MNDAEHAAYSAYLRHLAQLLLVGDWEIALMRLSSDDGARAQISLHREKDEASVFLHRDFFGFTREQQRRTLVHELLHIQTARICRAMTQLAEQFADHSTIQYACIRLGEEEEILIDRLARSVAPLLPLPPGIATPAGRASAPSPDTQIFHHVALPRAASIRPRVARGDPSLHPPIRTAAS